MRKRLPCVASGRENVLLLQVVAVLWRWQFTSLARSFFAWRGAPGGGGGGGRQRRAPRPAELELLRQASLRSPAASPAHGGPHESPFRRRAPQLNERE